MEEINNENQQYKYEEMDRQFNYGMKQSNKFDWDKPGQKWHGGYGNKWQGGYGSYFPGGYGPYFPGNYGGIYGWPWFLLALKSMSPRDLMRYKDEADNMNY